MDIQEKVQSKDYNRASCCTVDQIPYLGFFFFSYFCYLKTASRDRRLELREGIEEWCVHQGETPG